MALEKARSLWKFKKGHDLPRHLAMCTQVLFLYPVCLNHSALLTYEPCGFRYVSTIYERVLFQVPFRFIGEVDVNGFMSAKIQIKTIESQF